MLSIKGTKARSIPRFREEECALGGIRFVNYGRDETEFIDNLGIRL